MGRRRRREPRPETTPINTSVNAQYETNSSPSPELTTPPIEHGRVRRTDSECLEETTGEPVETAVEETSEARRVRVFASLSRVLVRLAWILSRVFCRLGFVTAS